MPSDAHTFLFMALVGFSALTAERGDDSAADVALRLFASVRRVLPRYRGSTRLTLANNRKATSAALSSPRSAVSAEKPTRAMNRKVCASLGIAGLAYRWESRYR